jgi:hypothetical protein
VPYEASIIFTLLYPVYTDLQHLPWINRRCPLNLLMNFRHLFEQNNLGAAMFDKVGELLLANGMKLSGARYLN